MKVITNITLTWKVPFEAENMDTAALFEVLKEAAAEIVDEKRRNRKRCFTFDRDRQMKNLNEIIYLLFLSLLAYIFLTGDLNDYFLWLYKTSAGLGDEFR